MKFAELSLPGAFEITQERRTDARGYFARIYCDDEFSAQGLNTAWVQMNLSSSDSKGTLRGLHFQREPAAEVKLVRCIRGRVHDVIVDLRTDSATFGKYCSVTLESKVGNALYIPKGLAHGFQTLTDDCELLYAHSSAYKPGTEGGINALDPELAINWPLPPINMSGRDEALGSIKNCTPL